MKRGDSAGEVNCDIGNRKSRRLKNDTVRNLRRGHIEHDDTVIYVRKVPDEFNRGARNRNVRGAIVFLFKL